MLFTIHFHIPPSLQRSVSATEAGVSKLSQMAATCRGKPPGFPRPAQSPPPGGGGPPPASQPPRPLSAQGPRPFTAPPTHRNSQPPPFLLPSPSGLLRVLILRKRGRRGGNSLRSRAWPRTPRTSGTAVAFSGRPAEAVASPPSARRSRWC